MVLAKGRRHPAPERRTFCGVVVADVILCAEI
jgi:hypothetical protein